MQQSTQLGSQRKERPQPVIAEIKPEPYQDSENDRHEERWIADAHVCRRGPAEVSYKQNGAEDRRSRN